MLLVMRFAAGAVLLAAHLLCANAALLSAPPSSLRATHPFMKAMRAPHPASPYERIVTLTKPLGIK